MRWTIGLALGFAVMLIANAVLVWVAVDGADPIDPSYESEER